MEQFVLVPVSVYNKSVTTQSVTMQELPNYKAEQPPTYQIACLKRDNNKKLFGKADSLIDKILSCSLIKLSNSRTIILDGVDTGVLTSDFTLNLRRKNVDVPDNYFNLLDAAGITPSLVFNQNAKAKDRGSWLLLKVWTSEATKTFYVRCCCLRFCVQLGKSYQNSCIKGETILHSKASYTKLTLTTRNFKTMRAFARYKNEIWCMDLA